MFIKRYLMFHFKIYLGGTAEYTAVSMFVIVVHTATLKLEGLDLER